MQANNPITKIAIMKKLNPGFAAFTLFLAIFFACKSTKNSGDKASDELTAKNAVLNDPIAAGDQASNVDSMRLVVYFFSVASGSDYEHIVKLEDYIGEYAHKHNKKVIDYQKKAWGREGETDFCLKLEELSPSEQESFILGVRDVLSTAQHVNIFENQPCLLRGRR